MRDLSNRLDSYLTQTLLPRLVSLLGSGWETEGTVLTDPEGREFLVHFILFTRQLIIQRARDEDRPVDELPGIAAELFASPESLAEAIKSELLPQCASQRTYAGSHPRVPAPRDSASQATAEPTPAAL